MEEALPAEARIARIDLVQTLAEDQGGLPDADREGLLAEGDQRVAGTMFGVGDRQRRGEPMATDLLDCFVQVVE
jgi:hypothetical protein